MAVYLADKSALTRRDTAPRVRDIVEPLLLADRMVRALPSEALPGCQPSSPPGRGNCIGTPVASDVRIGAVDLEVLDAVGGPDL